MQPHQNRFNARILIVLFLIVPVLTVAANAQKRDYLTDAEIELVRDAQEIDRRIVVLTKAIDRRFTALGTQVDSESPGKKVKISGDWGEPPEGTRPELLLDIKKLLQKAIDDIDNVAAHPSSAPPKSKEEKNEAERFPNAVRHLAAAAAKYVPLLRSELDRTSGEIEKGPILDSIEFCQQIIEAAQKLPAAEKKK